MFHIIYFVFDYHYRQKFQLEPLVYNCPFQEIQFPESPGVSVTKEIQRNEVEKSQIHYMELYLNAEF